MQLKAVRLIPGTKITKDTQDGNTDLYTYQDLVNGNIPDIGVHAKLNRLVIIDVDIPQEGVEGGHKHDGRPWWKQFCTDNQIPLTYTVQSRSGGYHFYYALPPHIHEDHYHPPGNLALGVDVKYNGFVGAPPTKGYRLVYPQLNPGQQLSDAHQAIAILPPALFQELERKKLHGNPTTYEGTPDNALRRTFSEQQLTELRYKIRWIQEHCTLNRDQWRDGIFSLKSGLHDRPDLLQELITMWTCNRSFQQGDVEKALEMASRSDPFGRVGPGTIFGIINEVIQGSGFVAPGAANTAQEILDKAGIMADVDKKGKLKVTPSEANAAAIFGAMYPHDEMYWDIRQDLYIFKGRPASDVDIVNAVIPTVQKPLAGFGLEKLGKRVLSDGLDVVMYQRQVDPHREYLQNLRWDGVSRIESCLIDYLGVENSEYNRMLGINLWTALAARGLKPGSKFDSVFVFEGYEGIKKSSFVEFIGGAYTYAPSTSDIFENLDCLRQMHQSVIVELPELKGLIDSDPETAKAFLAKPYDHIRGLWAKKAMRRDRGFVIMGTTNSTHYLQKDMGIRRWWPIRVPRRDGGIDLAGLSTVRDQLFAEGVQKFRDGHKYWYMPEELLAPVVSMRQSDTGLCAHIAELMGSTEGFSVLQVFAELTRAGVMGKRLTPQITNSITEACKLMGYTTREENFRTVFVRPPRQEFSEYRNLLDLV